MKKIKELDIVTKILLVMFITVFFYFVIFALLKPFFIRQPTTMFDMMSQMMGTDMLNFTGSTTMNVIALLVSLGVAIVVSFYLFQPLKHITNDGWYELMKKGLSLDEQSLLDEVKKAKEITQDSLRFRLNWSKAKISTILTNLDRMGFIQRERVGKTYKVYLQNGKRF